MSRIERLVFWMGGVVTLPLWQLTLEASKLQLTAVPVHRRFALMDLQRALALGAVSADEYCYRATQVIQVAISPAELEQRVLRCFRLTLGMLWLIDRLAETYSISLLADLPRTWAHELLSTLGLSGRFATSDILVTSEYRPANLAEDLFERLKTSELIVPGKTLFIDYDWLRAEATIRSGLDVALFVDVRRLYRDLGLWGLVPLRQTLPDEALA